MPAVSFYDLNTGLFTGAQLSMPEPMIAANTPPSCGAMPGRHHHLKVKVDTATGKVVSYTPPKPPDTDLKTYTWDATEQAWIGADTELAVANAVRSHRARLLAETDWVALRAADIGPQPGDAAWLAYRAALRDVPEQTGFPRQVVWPDAPGSGGTP